ncbi:MAG: diguanylate cyclase [Gammaproteobacteria bacterium]|nr:diguanylate cyclase [Gammaproteobacteria bacterium]
MNYFTAMPATMFRGLTTLVRASVARWSADSDIASAFQQSPKCTLLADAFSLRIVGANEALRRALGYSEKELRNLSLGDLFEREDDNAALIQQLRKPDPKVPLRARQRPKTGKLIEVEITGYRVRATRRPLLAFITNDVTLRNRFEARQLEKQGHLDHLAHHDQLTGLPNRLFLAAHLPNAVEVARRNGQLLAILFLDLDRFKHINDSRGHETGDRLLQAVAQRIRDTTREDDMVVRMGGDEFIVVLKNVANLEQVDLAATRIIEALSGPFDIEGKSLVTTASIGVSLFPRDGADMGELLRHSDTAMYHAKDRGRNNCQIFSPMMDRRLKQRMLIETQLREAMQTGQLGVHYQPIVDLASQKIVALESLLRWKHPTYGFVAPKRFIGIAEETGLIVPIGEFVLQRVLEDAARWRSSGCALVPIAINVSAIQLQRSNLPELITRSTQAHGFSPTLLQVELTESTIFERREGRNGELSQDAVTHLRELGVHIAIDDFGTGYSSLSYLKRWRVDSLKIDRSFVRDLVTDPSDLAIVGAITAMARHLNIPVTAEGIEGWQQLAKLRELGCQLAQGHLFSKPVPASECVRYLRGGHIDLIGGDRRIDTLEQSGVHPALLDELLQGTTGR